MNYLNEGIRDNFSFHTHTNQKRCYCKTASLYLLQTKINLRSCTKLFETEYPLWFVQSNLAVFVGAYSESSLEPRLCPLKKRLRFILWNFFILVASAAAVLAFLVNGIIYIVSEIKFKTISSHFSFKTILSIYVNRLEHSE